MTAGIPRDADGDELPWLDKWQARTGCPPVELLLPAREGAVLPGNLGEAVRAHFAACRLCTELVAVLGETSADPSDVELRRIDRRMRLQTRNAGRWWWGSLGAAAALLAVAGAAYFARSAPQPDSEPAVAQPSTRPLERQPVLALNAPPILLPPESLKLRGDDRQPYGAAIEEALTTFAAANYPDAVVRLERITRDHPRRPHAEFYLGVSRLMTGAAAEAVPSLERARQLAPPASPLHGEATWYLAVALERSGRGEAAAGPLNEICGGGGPRKTQACEGVRLLSNR